MVTAYFFTTPLVDYKQLFELQSQTITKDSFGKNKIR